MRENKLFTQKFVFFFPCVAHMFQKIPVNVGMLLKEWQSSCYVLAVHRFSSASAVLSFSKDFLSQEVVVQSFDLST